MLTPEQVRKVREMFAEGATPEQVAEALGMAPPTLRYHIGQSGYKVRHKTVRCLEPLVPVGNADAVSHDLIAA